MALSKANSSASHPLPQFLRDLESREPKDAVSFHYLKQPKPWTTYTSSSKPTWKYDVFLSFRGEDTRQGFVSHLYDELQSTGRIKTFKDDRGLQVGMFISNLLRAIEESMLAIVVLSPNYASSPWCLDELTHIFEFMEGRDRILPIFYHVDPAAVRHQLGSFATAFTDHEKKSRHSEDKLNQWRVALKQVANISGWNTKNFESERELVKRIVKVVSSKTTLEVQLRPVEIDVTITSTSWFRIFESTRQALDGVIKSLIDDEVTTIGVHGMGGVGKTTMVKNVGEQACNNRLFDQVIKATASQNPDVSRIQGNFAEQLGLRLESESVNKRAVELKNMIMRSTRILIILDDIWERIDLSCIGIPNPDELKRCNSKLLLTTRRLDVCHSMECQASFPLNMLSKEDSLSLFVEQSRIFVDEFTEIYQVAKVIAGECAGLPISLIATARALVGKHLDVWKVAAKRLRQSQRDYHDAAFNCIKLSYDDLKSENAKSLFLLCCLFPEDYDIPIEDLFKYAIGNGLFQEAVIIQDARARANLAISYLKASSLLLDSPKEGCVKMHDVVRDSALSIARFEDDHRFLVIAGLDHVNFMWPRKVDEGYSAISLMMSGIHWLPEELVCPKLRILLLQNNAHIDEIPEFFFQYMNALRVLDISFARISSLPRSFSILANLQALFLDYCSELIDISIFGNMKKLEVLSMKEFPLKELPKEMRNLTNLRMLDLSGSYNICMFPYNVMSRWCKLEELYLQCNSGDWGSEIYGEEETNVGPNELFGLTHLNIVKLHISDANCLPKNVFCDLNWVTFDICISRESPTRDYSSKPLPSHDHSRTLTLNTTINSLPDWFINTVTEKAETLQYLKCRGLKNLLVECNRGRLHGLKNLVVIGPHENLEVLMETLTLVPNKPVFENLEELHLLGVRSLKELCLGELPVGSLCNLKLIKVEYCHDLVNALLPSNLWQRLQKLERLICEDMNGMEYVFGSKGMEPKDIILINLREMRLWNLEKLIGIWNGPAPNAVFSNLKSLAVYGCTKLKSVFTYDIAQYLLHLEELSVTQCSSLDSVIESRKEAVNKIGFPELKNLALSYLPQLKRFCSTEIATIECPSLEHLHVQDCPSFSTSISDFHCTKQFQVNDLRHLRMSNDLDNINLAGRHTIDILESLPHNVRKRVEMMREIESQRDELEAKFLRERAELEAKYQNLYQTLYGKRYLIVNGVVEAEGVATEAGADEDSTAKERGVPDFWLNALKNNKVVAKEITECDEGALKYLRDIKWFKIHDSKGFILEFYFDSNPFFKNSVLTKTYQMIDEDEPNSAPETEIEWYPAKCLTQKILKKKCKKGSKNSKPLTKIENCKSFFNFYSPPRVSKDNEVIDEVAAKELKNQKKQDYDVGSTISRKIIPQAVSWFTGEAI